MLEYALKGGVDGESMSPLSPDLSNDELSEMLTAWLRSGKLSVNRTADPRSDLNLTVASPVGVGMSVIRPSGEREKLVVSTRMALEPGIHKRFLDLPLEKRSAFIYDMATTLLSGHYKFGFEPTAFTLQSVYLEADVWFEDLSRSALLKAVQFVIDGAVLTQWKVQAFLLRPSELVDAGPKPSPS